MIEAPPPPRLQLLRDPASGQLEWGYPLGDDAQVVDYKQLQAGTRIRVGAGFSTVFADMDFEAYSEAGHIWNPETQKWVPPVGAKKRGLSVVGAANYAMHPSTEVLSLSYNLKLGAGKQTWTAGSPPPDDLFDHLRNRRPIEAHNAAFEYWIWEYVCRRRMGWPELPLWLLRDSMAKARAFALPGALDKGADVLQLQHRKNPDGQRLLKKFSMPRQPTKNDQRTRVLPAEDPQDFARLLQYNQDDIAAESELSARVPDLDADELEFFQSTLEMNIRGVQIDTDAVRACMVVLEQALERYDGELYRLTGGAVERASQVQRLQGWLGAYGVHASALDADALADLLARDDLHPAARRALKIRQLTGSAGVKKLYALARMTAPDGRAHDLFNYHGARTGRDTASDIQPQNLTTGGPSLRWCEGCDRPYGVALSGCPFCGTSEAFSRPAEWGWEAVEPALEVIRVGSLDWVEFVFGDALLAVSGCIRGLFVAAPGHDFIASDYSSIEAVVTAALAREQWRLEVFQRKEDIYYHSAGRVTGVAFEEYLAYKATHGTHHPDRKKYGKPGELGLGFGGWINAWRQFDKSDNFSDDDIKRIIVAWREASPRVVELWGGQVRGKPWAPDRFELFGLEGAAISAVQNPGTCYSYGDITYGVYADILYCRLPSGRRLTYHKPRLEPSERWEGQVSLTFEGWNTNPRKGALGWQRMTLYGGLLTENVVQATARDILRHAVKSLRNAGYPAVLRVHDELVAEVPEGFGSVEEMERIMGELPPWAAGWPIRAAGGWRGKRYRKD
jgi:DNA polymerase bacteriophage-type